MNNAITRRKLLAGAALGAGSMLSGCDALTRSPRFQEVLGLGEKANFVVQRSLGDRMELAREYTVAEISPIFRSNGTRDPGTPAYTASAQQNFADWQLEMSGLFAKPQKLSLAALKAMPQRTQITRHDCVEGWSAIGQWTGVPLKLLLDAAQLSDQARYIVFHCADTYGATPYYESIDLLDAYHPQTIIAHQLNGKDLEIGNGAPLRLRVERQLGYKQAKYITGIQAVASLEEVGAGKGGYWEDVIGYQWYAGI